MAVVFCFVGQPLSFSMDMALGLVFLVVDKSLSSGLTTPFLMVQMT